MKNSLQSHWFFISLGQFYLKVLSRFMKILERKFLEILHRKTVRFGCPMYQWYTLPLKIKIDWQLDTQNFPKETYSSSLVTICQLVGKHYVENLLISLFLFCGDYYQTFFSVGTITWNLTYFYLSLHKKFPLLVSFFLIYLLQFRIRCVRETRES